MNYLHTYVTIILFHICKSCKILQVMITIYTLSVTQNVVGKNANRNFCYHKSCWNRCSNNDFWNSCSNKSCWNRCFNKSCWNSHQRNFVPTIIGGTVVPTMIVGTAVPTIIVLTAYYWKSCVLHPHRHSQSPVSIADLVLRQSNPLQKGV